MKKPGREPAGEHLLDAAISHARRAVALDDRLAEARRRLRSSSSARGIQARRCSRATRRRHRAGNWRHFFRLGHASWGAERLRRAHMLALYPDFAFAHFQIAMVHVARGYLSEAEAVLRQGAAVQDRQISRGDRYPALGLHWMLGLVRLAQDDVDEALRELEREHQLADPHRLYGREFAMNALTARGACLMRAGRGDEAAGAFRQALALYPNHAQSHLGLSMALRTTGARAEADEAVGNVRASLDALSHARPIEASLVRGHLLASEGRAADGSAIVCTMLDGAPPGFAAWTLPIEPLLPQLAATEAFALP
jgi:tetratricopeptide (TPR) repeat protein